MKIKAHRYVLYFLLLVVQSLFRLFSLNVARAVGRISGRGVFWLLAHERKKALSNLNQVFGQEKSKKEIQVIGKKVFENLGMNLGEWLKMPFLSTQQILREVEFENIEELDKVLKKGKGGIFLTAHFGNWEWMAAAVCEMGYRSIAIGKKIYFPPYNRVLIQMRLAHHVKTIYQDESPKKILSILKQNDFIGILPDQDVDKVNGIFIPFFGREAFTPTAPVAIARASGASIIPLFLIRKKNRFKLVVEKAIEVKKTDNKQEDLYHYTLQWNQIFERYIRQYPDQWVWMHRRWKTKKKEKILN